MHVFLLKRKNMLKSEEVFILKLFPVYKTIAYLTDDF